jgi:hypothetical protein
VALPVDELIEPLSKDQVEATIYDVLAAVGVKTTNWKRGGFLRTIIAIVATLIAGLTTLIAAAIRGTILEYATGVWLTILAYFVYGVTRIEATFAEGEVTLTNAGGGEYILDPGDLVLKNSATGKTYRNLNRIELVGVGSVTARVRAVEAGSASSANAGDVDDFVTRLLDVTVTNASPLVGLDAQSDADLRADCALARAALSPFGAKDAYAYFARRTVKGLPLTRADGTAIGVTRTQVVPEGNGEITVYVATASGDVDGDVDTPGDDLYIVDQNIKLCATPWGITETTLNATSVNITVQYVVYADTAYGATAVEVKTAVDSALTSFFAAFPLGGATINGGFTYWCFLSAIRGLIQRAHPAIVTVSLASPLADTAMSPGNRANLVLHGGSTVVLVTQ